MVVLDQKDLKDACQLCVLFDDDIVLCIARMEEGETKLGELSEKNNGRQWAEDQ